MKSFIYFYDYLQYLKYNVKRVRIFIQFLLGIPSSLIMSIKNKEERADFYLSMMKVICWWIVT